jgi:hypothetical protein
MPLTKQRNYSAGVKTMGLDSYVFADDKAYPETGEIQLESKGKPVGEKTKVPCQYPYGIDADKEWERIDGKDTDNKDLNAEWERI